MQVVISGMVEGVYKGKGLAQVFLHYVNQNGPHKNHAYDAINKLK